MSIKCKIKLPASGIPVCQDFKGTGILHNRTLILLDWLVSCFNT